MSTATPVQEYEVAVIGAGSGGFAAARTAASQGLKTALVDGAKELGGLCILRGCMPTKTLLISAEVLHLAGHAAPWGVKAREVDFDFAQVMARKAAFVREFADYRREQLAGGKFVFHNAQARFMDPHTLELSNGKRLKAAHFVIATGSEIAPSPLPQLSGLQCLTSDTALELTRLPKSLLVLGGGPVAVEFAQFFVRFGVKTTLVQRSPHILHEFDGEAVSVLETVLQREGLQLHTGTRLLDAGRAGSHKEIVFEQAGQTRRVQAEEVFYALGRIPNLLSLGLEKAGVQVEYNRIVTDRQMRTSQPHIFAAGDCTGLHEIVHVAIQQGETAAWNILHPAQPRAMDYRLLTEVVFTEPQLASVGLTEKSAHVRNIPYLVASYPFNDHGKSLLMEARDGFVKLLADPITGEILGGGCVGPMGGELIHEIVAAMHKRMTVHELAVMPHYHPTLAEIWTNPAEALAEKAGKTPLGAGAAPAFPAAT